MKRFFSLKMMMSVVKIVKVKMNSQSNFQQKIKKKIVKFKIQMKIKKKFLNLQVLIMKSQYLMNKVAQIVGIKTIIQTQAGFKMT